MIGEPDPRANELARLLASERRLALDEAVQIIDDMLAADIAASERIRRHRADGETDGR